MADVRITVLAVVMPLDKTTNANITNNTYMFTGSKLRGCLYAKPLRSTGSESVPERKLKADPSEDCRRPNAKAFYCMWILLIVLLLLLLMLFRGLG